MKVFLSYSHSDRKLAGEIKCGLEDYGLRVFMAHEDIKPSKEWADTILTELAACYVFIPILTEEFSKSVWTNQEIGHAIAQNKLIVPLKVTVDPPGFISRFQAHKIEINKIAASCEIVTKVIAADSQVGNLFKDALIAKFRESGSYNEAAHNTELLVSFKRYTIAQVTNIINHTIENREINDSYKARNMLRDFIYRYGKSIDSELLESFHRAIK